MRIVTRPAVLLVALVLPSAGIAHENSDPRTYAAIGLSVLDRGISLWLVRPKTMLGLELDYLELTWDEVTYASSVGPVKHRTSRVRAALTLKRQVSQGQVSKFVYLTVYGEDVDDEWKEGVRLNGGNNGPEIGLGGLWRPMKKVSVSIRQGWAFEKGEKLAIVSDNFSPENTSTETFAIRMQETRLLVLLHF